MKYKPEFLNRWTRPKNYLGATWEDYYGSGVGRHRDSDVLECANFQAMLDALGFKNEITPDDCPVDDDGDPTRIIVRENHWAVGWVEWIAIHESDAEGLQIADKIVEGLENYPIIDEELYSNLEDDECAEVWANCYNFKERLEYLRKHMYRPHGNVFKQILNACRGDWGAAADLLPCPSDLIR